MNNEEESRLEFKKEEGERREEVEGEKGGEFGVEKKQYGVEGIDLEEVCNLESEEGRRAKVYGEIGSEELKKFDGNNLDSGGTEQKKNIKEEIGSKIEKMMIRRLGTGSTKKKRGSIKEDGGTNRRKAMKSILIGNETLDNYFRKLALGKSKKEKELKSEIIKTNTELIEYFPILNLNENLKHKWNRVKQKIHIHFGFLKARRNMEMFGIDHDKSSEM